MNMPTRHEVGDKVLITEANFKIMMNSNRSSVTAGYPSDDYLAKVQKLIGRDCTGAVGVVTHTFPPRFDVSVSFGEQGFHMQDHWITPFAADVLRDDLKGRLLALNAQSLDDAELHRVFDGCVLEGFCIREMQKARDAGVTIEDIQVEAHHDTNPVPVT